MNNIHIIISQLTNDYNPLLLEFFPLLAILCAICVIINKNPIVSVLFLIGLFINVACLLALLGLNFLGLSYLLVYVGAVSILFLFILMLMSIRSSDLELNALNVLPLGILITNLLSITVYKKLYSTGTGTENVDLINNSASLNAYPPKDPLTTEVSKLDLDSVYYVSNLSWDKYLIEFSHIKSIGNILYTNYSIWLIITSLILLLAMVGSIIITIKPQYNN